MASGQEKDLVNIKIDGEPLKVPVGINLVQAAETIGLEIPHYCYHQHLSIVGNCRMCQLEIAGQAKLVIGCNTVVQEGMEVLTHRSSEKVRAAQAATLEFLLVNHPLDCTVCDQAGHCKLQDYHFRYNRQPSRFVEEKVLKPKAVVLGPTVMLDAERCILCTRCVRFCREVTKTNELAVFKRGVRSEIGIFENAPLDNPFSGTVVDLCPVGALTHRKWRFTSRIWFTNEVDTICPACATGCNVRVAVRDNQIVLVKGRLNSRVNKEWLCDRGRYGFEKYLPKQRVVKPTIAQVDAGWEQVFSKLKGLKEGKTLLLLSPDIHLEDYALIKSFVKKCLAQAEFYIADHRKELTELEALLVDRLQGANYQGADYVLGKDSVKDLAQITASLAAGSYHNILIIGDRAVSRLFAEEIAKLEKKSVKNITALLSSKDTLAYAIAEVVLPIKTVIEQSGLLVNREMILQYAPQITFGPAAVQSIWQALNTVAALQGSSLLEAASDLERTVQFLASDSRLKQYCLADIIRDDVVLS